MVQARRGWYPFHDEKPPTGMAMAELRETDTAAGGNEAAAFAPGQPLSAALLYRRCDPAELPFAVCSELEEAPGPIGQERAVEALEFAVRMRRRGYNVYALGASGSGRHDLIADLLRHKAATEPAPPDWCYVNNFADPQQPHRLQLPPGRGMRLSAAMKQLVEELAATLPAAFERDDYRARREVIDHQFKQRSEQAFGKLQQRAEGKQITLLRTPTGLALAPKRGSKVLTPEMFEELPPAEREQVQREIEGIQNELEAIMRQVPQWEREHRDAVRDLTRETTGFAIAHLMEELRTGYSDLPVVAEYLNAVERDIEENVDNFLAPLAQQASVPVPGPLEAAIEDAKFRRYQVNVIVDNGGQRGAPV